MNPPEVMALLAVVAGFVFVLRPLVGAIAKRIAGEHRRPGLEPAEREEILSEIQAVRQEVADLAERVDFTERLLARQQQDALPKPGR
jgi:ubiquinone biosynthesis protein UbiJ